MKEEMKEEMKERIWVAADVPTPEGARTLIDSLRKDKILNIKLGLDILSVADRDWVLNYALSYSFKIFWGGKFCDIPNIVGATAKIVSSRKVAMFDVHASCGRKAMESAVKNKGESKVLAVTLLPSLDQEDLFNMGYSVGTSRNDIVGRMVVSAVESGVDGIFCSAGEVELVKAIMPNGMIVVSDISPTWAVAGDQKRLTTPAKTIRAGATDLVIDGSMIINPPPEIGSPAEAIKRIVEEMEQAIG